MTALYSHLRGQPATKRKADQRRPFAGQRFEDLKIEMHEIIDGVEILRPRRIPEPGTSRRNDFSMSPEQFEKAGRRIDGLEAMQQQDLRTRAPSQEFELDPAHR